MNTLDDGICTLKHVVIIPLYLELSAIKVKYLYNAKYALIDNYRSPSLGQTSHSSLVIDLAAERRDAAQPPAMY